MKYYKNGIKSGRLIGKYKNYSIYSEGFISVMDEESRMYEKNPDEINFAYGPSAGGLEESIGFTLQTPGEIIKNVDVNPSYKMRDIKIINDDIYTALLKIERVNGYHAASNSVCFLLAVEDALEIENSDSNNERIIEIELERIRSNLHVIKGLCESAGFSVPEKQVSYIIERVSRIISVSFRHRFFFGANLINMVNGNIDYVLKEINDIEKEFRLLYNDLLASKIFMDRLQENGIYKDVNSIGPAARAAGLKYDARIDSKSLLYDGYNICTYSSGDVFARFMVRSNEIFSACDIILNTRVNKYDMKKYDLNKSGEGAARIESPQGDIFYYVKIDHGRISDIIMSSPSVLNLYAFKKALPGNIFTDFFFVWESFGIWVSEMGVNFI